MQDFRASAISDLFSTGRLFEAAIIILVTWLLLRLLHWTFSLLAKRFSRYRMQIIGSFPVVRILGWVIAVYLVIVKAIQPPDAQLLAMLASVGLAVGLASQDVIRNLISGMLILFERPIRVGDMVQIGEHYGEIISIGLRSVQLRTFNDSVVTIPNATVMSQSISNSNSGALDELVPVKFFMPAYVEVQVIKDLAWEAAACSPYAYLAKPINVIVEDVFDRTFLTAYTVKAYVLDVRYEKLFASDVIERIKRTLLQRKLITQEIVLAALASAAT